MIKYHLPVYDEAKCALFALGRNAIYAACGALKIGQGDEVITPAFDCDGTLQPFKALKIKMSFFKSDPYTFAADINDIKKRVTSRTKLIHIINHFGFPQPWGEILSLSKEKGIPILEDNAYSLFSKYEGKQFGTFGDISIFSLRKNLSLIDGGLLRINNPGYRFNPSPKSIPLFYSTELSGVLTAIKTILGYYKASEALRGIIRKFNKSIDPPPPLYSESERGYPEWPSRDQIGREFSRDYLRPMSRLARFQLSGFSGKDLAEIADKKRFFYLSLAERLNGVKGVTVLWPELPEGVVPFCLSVLIDLKRDIFLDALRKKYDVMAWPTLPRLILERLNDYPEVELLGRKLFQINLPSDKVKRPDFSRYLEGLIKDMRFFSGS
jgi:perosamine synthetase